MRKNHTEIIISTDGGSRGNPGPAAVGAVLKDKNEHLLSEISKYIGNATNNVAEYMAVIYSLQEALMMRAEQVVLRTDSQLVARHLKGEYKVKDKDLKKFYDLALHLCGGFDKVDIVEIPREDNEEADALVNKALDDVTLL
jgi:ribonuclease HI